MRKRQRGKRNRGEKGEKVKARSAFPSIPWLHLVSMVSQKDGLLRQGSGTSGCSWFWLAQTSHPGSHDPFSGSLLAGK